MGKNEEIYTESRIQQNCVRWYRNNYCLVHHSPRCLILSLPNEGNPYLTQTGALSGASDLLVVHRKISHTMLRKTVNTRILWVECKTRIGRVSTNQKKFKKHILDIGHEYHLIRSLDDFKKIIFL